MLHERVIMCLCEYGSVPIEKRGGWGLVIIKLTELSSFVTRQVPGQR
jgi:hypothetical protein